jgi:DNA-binding NtrC family response regulator
LVRHFIQKNARRHSAKEKRIAKEAMTALINFSWPGNIRELENAVERAFILSENEITTESLPSKIVASLTDAFPMRDSEGLRPTLEEMERRYILEVLRSVDNDKAKAAHILGIDLSTLYRKIRKYEENRI